MKRIWTIVEKMGQEYFYQIKAESKQEAIELVKKGKAGTAKHTRKMPATYNGWEV